jgi:Terminase large subunit, T4likevirus-type, N-terminal
MPQLKQNRAREQAPRLKIAPAICNDICHSLDPVAFARDRLAFHPDPRQALVLASRAKQIILNCTRQWGKSTVTAARAVFTAWHEPDSLILVLSPAARQSSELVRKASAFLRRLGVRCRGDGANGISLLLPNRSRIVGLPASEATVRGFSGVRLLLVDEAARVDEDLYLAMRPVLAASDGDLLLMSTPFGRRGFFHQTWTEGGSDWQRVKVPATECPRIRPETLQRDRTAMGDRWFRQEYLCEFADNVETLFPEDLIRKAIKYDIQPLFR